MGRKAEPGLSYYRMNCGHTMNKKVRLLVNDHKGCGYWIWQCLLDHAYISKGYYFDCAIKDELEVFATDICKETLEVVESVIACCVRRGLFDKRLYDQYQILTSAMMQEVYLDATAERRRKGTEVEMLEQYVLVNIPENSRNILILPGIKTILPRNNSIVPVNNPQSQVEESKVNPNGVAPAKPALPKKVVKPKDEEKEPYWDKLVKVWFDFGKDKFGIAPSFERDDPKIFKRIIGRLKKRAEQQKVEWTEVTGPERLKYFLNSAFADEWISKNFLMSNLEKQFDKVIQNQTDAAKRAVKANTTDLQYLFDRYLEGQLNSALVNADHYDQLAIKQVVVDLFWQQMVPKRVRSLNGSNQASELRLLQAYQEGKDTDERKADIAVLKRLAVIEAFSSLKVQQIKLIP
jgi:hypothetical protein